MVERENVNVPMVATVGIVSVIFSVALVFALQALYFSYANDETRRKVTEAPTAASDSRVAEQEAKLTRYSWINRDDGTVTIPIERAMRLIVVEERARGNRENSAANSARRP
jgi:hypothetical protein